MEDYRVRLYHDSTGKPNSKRGPIDVTVRASSADDAARQAKAQNPGYHLTASPVKKTRKPYPVTRVSKKKDQVT